MSSSAFINSALQTFKGYKELAEKTFEQLSDGQFGATIDGVNNSVAVNITHMHGNMLSRFTNFLTEDGEKEWRQRDAEFEERALSRTELLQLWNDGWSTVFNALEPLEDADLQKTIYIRTKPLSVIEAIHRQLTHYAYHVGQIVLLGKHFKGDDWKSLSIKKNESEQFNEKLKNSN